MSLPSCTLYQTHFVRAKGGSDWMIEFEIVKQQLTLTSHKSWKIRFKQHKHTLKCSVHARVQGVLCTSLQLVSRYEPEPVLTCYLTVTQSDA